MNIQCSWKVSDERPITDAIVSTGNDSSDLVDDVAAENCLMLLAPDNDNIYPTTPACQLILSCPPPNQISKLSVFSEARFIEVYGHNGEYLKTIKNVLIEEDEDMIVFKSDIFLDRPINVCSIKFLSLRSPLEMWLFGLKIQTQKMSYIPHHAIEQGLQNVINPIMKPEEFKYLYESMKASKVTKQEDFDKEYLGNECIQRDLENKLQNPAPDVVNNHTPIEPVHCISISTSPISFENLSSSTQTDGEYLTLEDRLKKFINEQLEELDKRQWERVNKRFQEVEAKILCKLDEIESFVKPQGVQNN